MRMIKIHTKYIWEFNSNVKKTTDREIKRNKQVDCVIQTQFDIDKQFELKV